VRYGSARDLLIGIRVALADGQIVRGGGQVVKNVAGYDLPKLFVGSLGTLGVIVEATFKVAPLPKITGTILASFHDLEHASRVTSRVLTSPLLPLSIEVLSAGMREQFGGSHGPFLAVRFGGIESEITRQLNDVSQWSQEEGGLGVEMMKDDNAFWERIRDFPMENRIVLKVGLLPSQIGEIGKTVEKISNRHGLSCSLSARAVGLVFIALDGSDAQIVQALDEIGQVATSLGGHYMIQRSPRALREKMDIWGPPRNDWTYMQKIKRELDPNAILNPGRFLFG
jgi:glycolate oxidase FAD binding subunit